MTSIKHIIVRVNVHLATRKYLQSTVKQSVRAFNLLFILSPFPVSEVLTSAIQLQS